MAVPAWYAKVLTYVVPPPLLPFNRDQVIMSQEDNSCDLTKFTEDFGWHPRIAGGKSLDACGLETYSNRVPATDLRDSDGSNSFESAVANLARRCDRFGGNLAHYCERYPRLGGEPVLGDPYIPPSTACPG